MTFVFCSCSFLFLQIISSPLPCRDTSPWRSFSHYFYFTNYFKVYFHAMIHHLAFIAATACVSIIHHLAFIVCHCLCIDQLIQIFIKFISRFHSSCLPCLFVGFLSFQVYEPSAVPINLTFNAVPTSLSTSLQFQSHHVSFANISSSCLRLASSTPCVFHCLNCPCALFLSLSSASTYFA